MSEREKLIKELEKLRWQQAQRIFLGQTPGLVEEIADFILEDRKRIVEPLVNLPIGYKDEVDRGDKLRFAIDETLTLAGLNER